MNKPPDKDELDAVAEARPGPEGLKARLVGHLARMSRGTWAFLAWLVFSILLFYPADRLSKLIESSTLDVWGVLAIVLALFSGYIGKVLDERFHAWLYREVEARCRQVEELICFARDMKSPQQIPRRVVQSLDQIFGVQGTAIYGANRHDGFELISSSDAGAPTRLEADELLFRLERYRGWQRGESAPHSKLGVKLAWPIEEGGRLIGLLVIWQKGGSAAFQEKQEVECVKPLCDVLALAMKDVRNPEKELFFKDCAQHFARDVSAWFATKFAVLESFAKHEALQTDNVSKIRGVLPDITKELGGLEEAFSGVYVLNERNVVIDHKIDHKSDVEIDIRGWNASARDYCTLCRKKMGPIVCDSKETSDRRDENDHPIKILVLAVPRFNKRSSFIGILDAVVDIHLAPFSKMAVTLLGTKPLPEAPRVAAVRLLLIDSTAIVLGTSDLRRRRPRASMDASVEVETLRAGLAADEKDFVCNIGAIARVDGTPFLAIAYEPMNASLHRG